MLCVNLINIHLLVSQGLIQEPHEVYSSYTYSYCYVSIVVNDTSACLESIIKEVDIAALIPPFNYNYQCGSVVLTSYIPVFIYGKLRHVRVGIYIYIDATYA